MKPYARDDQRKTSWHCAKELKAQYRELQGKDLKLDMSRGKPEWSSWTFHGSDGCFKQQ